MMSICYLKDLIVLVADKDMEYAVKGLLERHQSFPIKPVTYDIFVHPERDPGCRTRGPDFLRPYTNQYAHALLIFDKEGCGREQITPDDLEKQIENRFTALGWGDRTAVIVIDPELEAWVWSDSPLVDSCLGWSDQNPDLRTWLKLNEFLPEGRLKPDHPKKTLEKALHAVLKPKSSSIFYSLATNVSFKNCLDSSFNKFRSLLLNWFPQL